MHFHFPVIIIDEDFRSENASGLGIRALADAIKEEGFEVLGVTSYGDLTSFAQQQSRASAFMLSIDDEEFSAEEAGETIAELRSFVKEIRCRNEDIPIFLYGETRTSRHIPNDVLRELHELVLFEDGHLDAVPAAGLVDEVELRAHRVRQVRGREQEEQDPHKRAARKERESGDEEDGAPDEATEVELRVRVHGRDAAQRDRLRGRAERDHAQQGVRALVHHTHVARGDAGLEPEEHHGRAEPVADDVGLPRRVSEFGHGLCGFGHVLLLCFVLCLFFLSPSRFPYGVWDEETV
mgnify:CR=1 FL=1